MPTQFYDVTAAPVNLIGANDTDGNPLDLEIGKRYTGRFVALGPQAIMKVLSVPDATVVAAGDAALPMRNFEDLAIIPATGEAIFVWSEAAGQLVINEIPR